jgi:hypothetical protein
MKIGKAFWSFLIAGVIFGVALALYWLTHTNTDAEFNAAVAWSLIAALPCAWLVKSIGNIARRLLWRANGYAKMPLFIYPVFIDFTAGLEPVLNFDPIGFFALVAPPGYSAKTPVAHTDAYDIEKKTFLIEYFICIIIGVASLLINAFFLLFAIVFFVVISLIVAGVEDDLYHGQTARIRLLRSGFLPHYLAHTALINGEDTTYILDAWKRGRRDRSNKKDNATAFELIDLISLKYLLLSACARKESLPPGIMDHIESKIIRPLKLGRLFFDRESIEITKLFMYYGLIHAEPDKTAVSVNKFIALTYDRDRPMGNRQCSDLEWYINIGRIKRFRERNDCGKKMKVLYGDYPYRKVRSYKVLMSALETNLIDICRRSQSTGEQQEIHSRS